MPRQLNQQQLRKPEGQRYQPSHKLFEAEAQPWRKGNLKIFFTAGKLKIPRKIKTVTKSNREHFNLASWLERSGSRRSRGRALTLQPSSVSVSLSILRSICRRSGFSARVAFCSKEQGRRTPGRERRWAKFSRMMALRSSLAHGPGGRRSQVDMVRRQRNWGRHLNFESLVVMVWILNW